MKSMAFMLVVLAASVAHAQDVDAGVEGEAVDAGVAPARLPLHVEPAAEVAPVAAAPAPVLTARQRRAGDVSVGLLGTSSVLRATVDSTFDPSTGRVISGDSFSTVPLLGVRWWSKGSVVGFEAGAGVVASAGSTEGSSSGGVSLARRPTTIEWVGHVALPLSLVSAEHVIVFVAPELRVGNSNIASNASGTPNYSWSINAGLRAGVELFFSFIGLDRLSLEVGTRIGVTHEIRTLVSQFALGSPSYTTTEVTRFSSSLVGTPWDVIGGALALRYYF